MSLLPAEVAIGRSYEGTSPRDQIDKPSIAVLARPLGRSIAQTRDADPARQSPLDGSLRYDDIILAQQKKHTLGCLGMPVTMQLTEIPTKIQQLFDDAGSVGGLAQTARLRGEIARFLHKHQDHDFS